MGEDNIDDVIDYNDVNNNKINDNTNNKNNNFVLNQYFVTPEDDAPENIDELLAEKFKELGIEVKYYFKHIGKYCVEVENPEALKELESLDYITLEPVGIVRALNPED